MPAPNLPARPGGPPRADVAIPARVVAFDGSPALPDGTRAVPAELAVEVVYGGLPFAVMMMTPADLADFALGFSLTEGVVGAASDIRGVRQEEAERGLRLHVDLAPERFGAHLARRRALSGRTGCGVCGVGDLAALPSSRPPSGPAPNVSVAAIRRALDGLEAAQPLNALTRAVHAAAWAGPDGAIRHVREDVGRHNALDKLIGALMGAREDPMEGFCLITSRCSFEMVEKAAAYGARTLVAISAPTSLAVGRARALDLTLAGIARRDTMTVFHGAERIVP